MRTVIHLADARLRAGGSPGLTDLLGYLGSESKLALIRIGAYFLLHRFFNEVSNAVLGPLPHISTHEVETIHPLSVNYWLVSTPPVCHGTHLGTHSLTCRRYK